MTQEWFALSIQQPWLDLILRGIKTVEVRSWAIKRRGPILLHAARAVDWKAAAQFGYCDPLGLPRGALVGYAEIAEVFAFNDENWYATAERHWVLYPLRSTDYGAVLVNVRALDRPVRCSGKRFFFPLTGVTLERALRQLRRDGTGLPPHPGERDLQIPPAAGGAGK
jgi:hypothetical protein